MSGIDRVTGSSRRRSVPHEWAWRCLLVLVSVSLTIGALELTLRLLVDRYRCDNRLGWTYRPGTRSLVFNWTGEFVHVAHFNGDGLRDDRKPPSGPDAGIFRITVLGDSFSAGLQVPVDASFPKRLETRLRSVAPNGRVEVRNAAVDGFGTAQALRLFVERVAYYRPNVVLLGLFLANDLGDNMAAGGSHNHYLATRCGRPYFELDHNGALVEVSASISARPDAAFDHALRWSELYAGLFPIADRSPTAFADWDVFLGRNAAVVDEAWRLTRALVQELNRVVTANGGKLIVLLMPHEREVHVDAETIAPRSNALNFDRAHALAQAFLREAEIPYVDLYPTLRNAIAKGEHPYLRRDMHWNSRGHEIVGEAIQLWLVDHCAELGLPVEGCQILRRQRV